MILDMLRKGQTWVTKGILIVLAITFAFGFGFSFSNFGFGGKVPEGTSAEVNGQKISLLDFYRARERLRAQYRESGVPEEALNQNFIDMTALNQLIDLQLLSQKAKELGFMVTDEELSEAIRSNSVFQVDGQFIGLNEYRAFVEQRLNQSVSDFEKMYREELLAQKVVKLMFDTLNVTDEELFDIYKIRNEKVNLNFVTISPEDFKDSYTINEKEIKKYYENNKSEFKTPELRSVRYVIISPDDFINRVDVYQEEIKSYYEAHPDKFRSNEDESRPLAEVKGEVEADIKKEGGKALFREFLENLKESVDKKSIDEITKENGLGEVKVVGPISVTAKLDDIPSKVVEKAFTIKQGEKTFAQVGEKIYIIQVSEVVPSRGKTLKEAEGEISERLQSMKAKEAAKAKANDLLNKAKMNGGNLEEAAISFGLKLQETGYFSRLERVPEINSDEIKVDAFFLDKKNPLASKVYEADEKIYIVSLKEEQDADPKGFEEEKGQLKEEELSQRKRELYIDWIQRLRQESKININDKLLLPQG